MPDVRAGPLRGHHHALPRGLLSGVRANLPLPGPPGQVQRDLGGLRGQPRERRAPVHPDHHRLCGQPLLSHAKRRQPQPNDHLVAPRAPRVHLLASVRGRQRRRGQLLHLSGRDQGRPGRLAVLLHPHAAHHQRLPDHRPLARVGLPRRQLGVVRRPPGK